MRWLKKASEERVYEEIGLTLWGTRYGLLLIASAIIWWPSVTHHTVIPGTSDLYSCQ